jgi:hypothetical protein
MVIRAGRFDCGGLRLGHRAPAGIAIMSNHRFSIAWLMGFVLVAAVRLAALRNASDAWAGAIFLLTRAVLGLAVVGALCRRLPGRASWLGFCVFGWGYLSLVAAWLESPFQRWPTQIVIEILKPRLGLLVDLDNVNNQTLRADAAFTRIGHDLWAVVAALLGGLLARLFFGWSADRPGRRETVSQTIVPPPRQRWLRPTIAGLALLISTAGLATIWSESDAPLWAGATLILTCGLLGMATLGALFGRGRRRQSWLGAALFGAGYLLVMVIRPANPLQPTAPIWDAIRWRLLAITRGRAPENARIFEALERRIPMKLSNRSLDDLLNYVKQATSTPSYPGIPFYVDPVGLHESERSLHSTITIDLEGVPLKTTLRLCLNQISLDYWVNDGYVQITSAEVEWTPYLGEPCIVAGHCLLALLAAGFGAVAAPMVAEPRVSSTRSSERT